MTDTITLKTKDICNALNVSRHQFRAWTENLAPYCHRATKERSAFRYDSADLLNFAVVKHLVENFGMSLSFISKFSQGLYSCVREPSISTAHPYIFITEHGSKCYKIGLEKVGQEGIVVDIQPAKDLVFQFLGLSSRQTQLKLGLRKVD